MPFKVLKINGGYLSFKSECDEIKINFSLGDSNYSNTLKNNFNLDMDSVETLEKIDHDKFILKLKGSELYLSKNSLGNIEIFQEYLILKTKFDDLLLLHEEFVINKSTQDSIVYKVAKDLVNEKKLKIKELLK